MFSDLLISLAFKVDVFSEVQYLICVVAQSSSYNSSKRCNIFYDLIRNTSQVYNFKTNLLFLGVKKETVNIIHTSLCLYVISGILIDTKIIALGFDAAYIGVSKYFSKY